MKRRVHRLGVGVAITRLPSMLNAEQFRAAVEQFAPAATSASCGTPTPTGSTPSTGPDSARSTTSRCREAGRRIDYRVSFNFLDQRRHHRRQQRPADWPGAQLQPAARQRSAQPALQPRGARAPTTNSRPLGVLSNAAQYGPTQPIDDPNSPTGFLRVARQQLDLGRQSGGDPESRRGEGRDLSRHRQHADRVPAAVGRGAPGQPQPRLRRERRQAEELHARASSTGSWRPAEAASRPGTIRSRPARCSRPISTTPRRARSVRASST